MKIKIKIIPYLIAFLILISTITATQPNPEVYIGTVFLEQELAKDGGKLTVETENQPLASKILDSTANFVITVEFDDPLTEETEGAQVNERLIWKLNDVEVLFPIQDIAEPDKTNQDFEIIAYANPKLIVNVSYPNNELELNEQLELTIIMENIGEGSATANINIMSDNLDSQIPATIKIDKQSINATKLSLKPTGCGEYNIDVVISYYNVADNLVDSITKPISFTSKSYEIELTSLEVSNTTPKQDQEISVNAIVSNKGSYDIENFEISFFDQNMNILQTMNSTGLNQDQTKSIQFNWQPPLATSVIQGIVNIPQTECDLNNNVLYSQPIVILTSEEIQAQQTEEQQPTTIIHKSNQTCIEHNVKLTKSGTPISLQPNCDLAVFEYKNKEYKLQLKEILEDSVKLTINSSDYSYETILTLTEIKEIDLALDDSYEVYLSLIELGAAPLIKIGTTKDQGITGFITKQTENKAVPIIAIIAFILVLVIMAFYVKKGAIKLPKFKKKVKQELEKEKPEIQQQLVQSEIKQQEPEKPIIKQRPIIPKPEIKKPIIQKTEFNLSEELKKQEKPKPQIPLTNIPTKIAQTKKIPKTDPGLSEEEKKLPQVPYEYLSEAIVLIEKVRKNLKPRDELIKKYSDKYPKFLIDLVAKNVFTYSNFNQKIDVVTELEKLGVLDKEYKYISVNKLAQAIEILAKGYASKENKNNIRGLFSA